MASGFTTADDGGDAPPSKSARKRAARAVQDLGEQLSRLSEAELEALALPEALQAALRAGKRITSRGAAARQRQYIGRLMRGLDPEPIRAALAARHAHDVQAAADFRRAEVWRTRLLAEGEPALADLARIAPHLDRGEWVGRIALARRERAAGRGAAARELFRALRALFATMPR